MNALDLLVTHDTDRAARPTSTPKPKPIGKAKAASRSTRRQAQRANPEHLMTPEEMIVITFGTPQAKAKVREAVMARRNAD